MKKTPAHPPLPSSRVPGVPQLRLLSACEAGPGRSGAGAIRDRPAGVRRYSRASPSTRGTLNQQKTPGRAGDIKPRGASRAASAQAMSGAMAAPASTGSAATCWAATVGACGVGTASGHKSSLSHALLSQSVRLGLIRRAQDADAKAGHRWILRSHRGEHGNHGPAAGALVLISRSLPPRDTGHCRRRRPSRARPRSVTSSRCAAAA